MSKNDLNSVSFPIFNSYTKLIFWHTLNSSHSCQLSTFEKMPSLSFRLFLGKNHRETFYIYYHKKLHEIEDLSIFYFMTLEQTGEFRHFSYRSKNDDSLQKTHFNDDDDDVVQVFKFLKLTLKTQT